MTGGASAHSALSWFAERTSLYIKAGLIGRLLLSVSNVVPEVPSIAIACKPEQSCCSVIFCRQSSTACHQASGCWQSMSSCSVLGGSAVLAAVSIRVSLLINIALTPVVPTSRPRYHSVIDKPSQSTVPVDYLPGGSTGMPCQSIIHTVTKYRYEALKYNGVRYDDQGLYTLII